MPKVSVIIPVLNAEEYLGQCLDTILTQTLLDIEVVCVDNASTDESLNILQTYATFDERLKIIEQERTMQAAALNNGLQNATGEFVCFMKTDDFYPTDDILQTLYDKAKERAVSVCGGELALFDPAQPQLLQNFGEDTGFLFDRDGVIEYSSYQFDEGIGRFIFDREFLLKNHLCFSEYTHGFEETLLVSTLHLAQRFYAFHKITYAQKSGATVQFHWTKEKVKDCWFAVIDNLILAYKNAYHQLKDVCSAKLMNIFPLARKFLSEDEQLILLRKTSFLYEDVEKKVSIIVPVYNEEKYLRTCLDSLLNQTLKDIEIICVDDGSTDNSLQILKECAVKDSRITFLLQQHQGQGMARNIAFEKATGEYVQYVDSDDSIVPWAAEYLYLYGKLYALDMIPFATKNIDGITGEEYKDPYTNFSYLPKNISPVLDVHSAQSFLPQMAVSAALTFYRKEFLENNNIRWESINYEDTLFFTECILKASRFGILNNQFYIRLMHSDSVTGSLNNNFGDYCDILWKTFQVVNELSDRTLLNYYVQFFLVKAHTLLATKTLPESQDKFGPKFYDLCVKTLKRYRIALPTSIEAFTTQYARLFVPRKERFSYFKSLYLSKILKNLKKWNWLHPNKVSVSSVNYPILFNKRANQRFVNLRYHFTNYKKKEPNKVSVLVTIHGGLGDALINLNWLYLLEKKFKNENLLFNVLYYNDKVFCALNSEQRVYKNIFPKRAEKMRIYYYDFTSKYDVVINIARVPYVELTHSSLKKIQSQTPSFYQYILSCQQFCKLHSVITLWRNNLYDCEVNDLNLSLGHKRIEQSNIDNLLPITEYFDYIPSVVKNEQEILGKFGLKQPFITFNRGVDGNSKTPNHTKLWTLSGYNKLIELIKEKYPQYQLVQLGVSRERCELLENIDVNLVGRTTLEELKVLLKNAYLHIDSEGGMVHLRHALTEKKSVVIFGPTDPNVYGYSNNLNIRSSVCPFACEWIRHDWTAKCLRTHDKAICMQELSAKTVFEHIEQEQLLK